ncbi:putative protein containing caspase domain protein [Candidatus Rubidus massiliensis]|nr:putative protein containing caspase domain protein [Candidatus Rubidus massiliensis]
MKSFFCIFFLLANVLFAQQVHFIVVADNQANNIEDVVHANQILINEFIQDLIEVTNLKINSLNLTESNFNAKTIWSCLKEKQINANDIILFYYTGHGYRNEFQETVWPSLYLTNEKAGLDFTDILQILQEKRPALLLALADCCNNIIPSKFAPPIIKAQLHHHKIIGDNFKKNVTYLFSTKGTVVISAAKAGSFAYGTSKGGFFTKSFLDSFNLIPHISWEESIKSMQKLLIHYVDPKSDSKRKQEIQSYLHLSHDGSF